MFSANDYVHFIAYQGFPSVTGVLFEQNGLLGLNYLKKDNGNIISTQFGLMFTPSGAVDGDSLHSGIVLRKITQSEYEGFALRLSLS